MAEMTIENLQEFVGDVVVASKQTNTNFTANVNNFIGLVDKIGKIVTLDGGFEDKLPELDGDNLPYGQVIEEYFMTLVKPELYANTNGVITQANMTTEGAKDLTPQLPSIKDVVYDYPFDRVKFKVTQPYGNIEKAMLDESTTGQAISLIYKRLQDSFSMYKYAVKKQLIGNAITKAEAVGLASTVAIPSSATTAEGFIQAVKEQVENSSFPNEGNNLANCLIGSAPSMTLYVKKNVLPTVDVKAIAGAINPEKLAFGVKVKVVDDFGEYAGKTYAVLMDDRMVKLHTDYDATRTSENADGDFINTVKHYQATGFISKYAFVHCFKAE